LARSANGPALPQTLDQRFLVLAAWGFMVPFIWGFSAKWLPTFLGTPPPETRILLWSVGVYLTAIIFGVIGSFRAATVLTPASSVLVTFALRVFATPEKPGQNKWNSS
jgi:hypothetical protein